VVKNKERRGVRGGPPVKKRWGGGGGGVGGPRLVAAITRLERKQ